MRNFLKGLGLADDVIEQIMGEHGKRITAAKGDADAQKQSLTAKDTEIAGLKEQLTQRDKDIKALKDGAVSADEIKKQLEDLQGKYKTDTDALTKKLSDQATEFAVSKATDKFFEGVKFSSALAKEAAVAQFRQKGLKLENGSFVGGSEWLAQLKKDAPDAFAAEPAPDDNKPNFGGSVKQHAGTPVGKPNDPNAFSFGFTPIRSAGLQNGK